MKKLSKKSKARKASDRKKKKSKQAKAVKAVPVKSERQYPSLSIAKENVVIALAAGMPYKQAAALAKVSRATLYRWQETDLNFVMALEAEKQKILSETTQIISSSLQTAALTIKTAIEAGDEKLAFAVLKETGMLALVNPESKNTTSQELEQQAAELIKKLACKMEEAELKRRAQAAENQPKISGGSAQKSPADV